MKIKKFLFHVLLTGLLFFSGCSYIPVQWPDFPAGTDQKEAPVSANEKDGLSRDSSGKTTSRQNEDAEQKNRIERGLAQGNVLAALDGVGENVRQGGCGQHVSSVYVRAVNQAIREAKSRLEQGRAAEAGPLFRAAQKHYPQDPALASKIRLTPAELDAGIAQCAQQLMEEGISAYRQERLEDAIEIWEKILVFDPMHRAGRSAIETAERQLANLKKIGTGPEQESR
ncbi:tetratricopeptide (TPR) repeat protein [Desulfosalsimonas propionicica]|uniref:Tetratricopeptide (TPR) repeat protein n=1 Tax=Desulfosalsimonas propionicica TaxID=332175 RepID=A0A7W0C9C1_9BACT|nr:hypothetical protein [Desulfosalsimonas propionicica]MBA2881542.1 tetratricopeptide (TPR) repeat protein [Desulfosalsimonas propionicica]